MNGKPAIDRGAHPIVIAVAPNGARLTQADHAAVPIRPQELAVTAVQCAEAGAAMIHLHVRDEGGRHSLRPSDYRPAIRAIKDAVGDALLIQVTSEAAGIYTPAEQMRLIDELEPDGVSLAIRELFALDGDDTPARFVESLRRRHTQIQYILYDPADVGRYRGLVAKGVLPADGHTVLFVLGRYSNGGANPLELDDYVAELGDAAPWMVCAFGQQGFDALLRAVALGGHVRIGFENGWLLPDGAIAADNAMLVRALRARIEAGGGRSASAADAAALYGVRHA